MTDASVYVDTSALEVWSSQMASINSQAVDVLNLFRSTVESLNDSWAGNSATGFLNSTGTLMNDAINSHNEMANVEKFLITVVETVDKA